MKFKDSIISRRKFLNGVIGGWLAALGATIIQPVVKFIFPPYQEPDEVILLAAEYQLNELNSYKIFPWGNKPGILKRNDDGSLTAFVAVCTHLDCNVTYLPDQRKFYCACHEGWYDEQGRNIGGPPPRPLRTLEIIEDGENLILRKREKSA